MEDIFAIQDSRPSAVDVVIEKIKELLIERKLSPGEMIPSESVLAESLKVGRGSVREALKVLSAYGVVEIKRGAGTYISSASNKRLFDASLFQILVQKQDYNSLTQVREILEDGIVKLVIQFASDEDLEVLNATLNRFLEELSKPNASAEIAGKYDILYHRMLGKYSHNPIIENIYNFVIELFAPTINPFHQGVYDEHKGLQEAIMARDEEKALYHVHNHTKVWIASHKERQSAD
jgi:GntR family transcriptional regulator, transcriptional repressor for pyruvate dehydrogenase complex